MTRRAKLSCGYYDDPLTLMYHVNNGLYSLRTEKTRAQMSYSSVTQKNDVTHDGEHQVHHYRTTVSTTSMLGFHKKVVTGTETTATSRVVTRPRLSTFRLLVPLPHRSPPTWVDMTQGFNTPIRIHGRRGVSYSG